jgi:hypothetical protein
LAQPVHCQALSSVARKAGGTTCAAEGALGGVGACLHAGCTVLSPPPCGGCLIHSLSTFSLNSCSIHTKFNIQCLVLSLNIVHIKFFLIEIVLCSVGFQAEPVTCRTGTPHLPESSDSALCRRQRDRGNLDYKCIYIDWRKTQRGVTSREGTENLPRVLLTRVPAHY